MEANGYCFKCGKELGYIDVGTERRLSCLDTTCGHVVWENPVPVVAGLVLYEEEIVLIQNRGWPADWFGLVTGYLEKNESPEKGIIREVKEELNLEAKVEYLIGNYIFEQKNEIILAYYLTAHGIIGIDTNELQDYKLVRPDKLQPWPFATGLAVKQWLEDQNISQSPK